MSVHTGLKLYACEICRKSFTTQCGLRMHIKAVLYLVKQHTCNLCEKWFACGSQLETCKHIAHTGEKPFICKNYCTTFPSSGGLTNHVATTHV